MGFKRGIFFTLLFTLFLPCFYLVFYLAFTLLFTLFLPCFLPCFYLAFYLVFHLVFLPKRLCSSDEDAAESFFCGVGGTILLLLSLSVSTCGNPGFWRRFLDFGSKILCVIFLILFFDTF